MAVFSCRWSCLILFVVLGLFANSSRNCVAESLLADFEGKDYGGWKVEGEAFGTAPPLGTLAGQHPVTGYLGQGLVNSFRNGDATTGTLTSPKFTIDHKYIAFLIGGGRHPGKTEMQLLIDGRIVCNATGADAEQLLWHNWDVEEFNGKLGALRIVDHATGGWGHINVDHVLLTDVKRAKIDTRFLQEYRKSHNYYRERYRPQYHFTPEINWMNDPNGLVYYEKEWHLFYQYNPFGNAWGHMSWGHAVSKDLVHWDHLPVALHEEDSTMIFSGCAVVDWNNTSGFGSDDKPSLVAVYTGHRSDNQSQCLAYSNDHGRTWTKYTGNPVLDIGEKDFRDPKVFWHKATNRWIMVVAMATKHFVQFYASNDLKSWKHLSDFGPAGAPDKPNWECPDLFELPIEGKPGKTKWVLEVDMGSGSIAGGSGGEYFIGDFNGTTFRCDHPLDEVRWIDYGRDFYAPVSWSDVPEEDGRRIWIGWMNNWETHLLPTHPWRSAQSIPREISLRETSSGSRMIQKPIKELQMLRGQVVEHKGLSINEHHPTLLKGVRGQVMEIIAEFDMGTAYQVGLSVCKGKGEETLVGYDLVGQQVFVDRTNSGAVDFHPAFAGKHFGPMPSDDGRVRLHIFVDQSSVEVFGNDGYTVITDRIFPNQDSTSVELFAKGGQARLISLQAWPLNSIWHK